MFNGSSLNEGLAPQLYAAMLKEASAATASLNLWTTLNIWLLILSTLAGILVAAIAPFVAEKRRAIKGVVVVLGLAGACLTAATGIFHPASTAQRFQNIVVELEQAAAQYNEEFHNLQPGPSADRDELALRDKYAAFLTQVSAEMNSINLSFGTLDTERTNKVPLTVPPVTVPPPTH